MAKSLTEQLLGAGLVDKKKVDKARKEKRKEKKSAGSVAADTQARLQQERAQQIARDRELNQQRLEQERARAIAAQVKQMLQHSAQRADGDIRFSFTDPRSNKIKQLYVDVNVQNQLARGQLAICVEGDNYVLVPRVVADKIRERQPQAVIFLAEPNQEVPAEDDPYRDFPIPDDLMW
ncbi:MAG: DUF2058 domain-containing protein [Pseudomonadales bacterium]|nr:DUF2058 domain-containing protein [Pseudomonadales bacterium]